MLSSSELLGDSWGDRGAEVRTSGSAELSTESWLWSLVGRGLVGDSEVVSVPVVSVRLSVSVWGGVMGLGGLDTLSGVLVGEGGRGTVCWGWIWKGTLVIV